MATVVPSALEAPEELQLVAGDELPEQVTLWQDAWRRLTRNRMAVVGLVIIGVFFVTAILSFFWTPYPTWRQALGPTYQGPSPLHPLGLDDFGRDILSRGMGGAAIALSVGVRAGLVASVISIGPCIQNIILAIAVTAWLGMARLVRGQPLALREREFVEAARSIGTKSLKIPTRHILPNTR